MLASTSGSWLSNKKCLDSLSKEKMLVSNRGKRGSHDPSRIGVPDEVLSSCALLIRFCLVAILSQAAA